MEERAKMHRNTHRLETNMGEAYRGNSEEGQSKNQPSQRNNRVQKKRTPDDKEKNIWRIGEDINHIKSKHMGGSGGQPYQQARKDSKQLL